MVTGRNSSRTAGGGFTLIELLVVIAVIAVLLAIFVPAARMAREQGQRAVCLSNLKQLTIAWIAYADDHDGKLVPGSAFSMRHGGERGVVKTAEGWLGRAFFFPESRSATFENPAKGSLWPYIRDTDVYRCRRGRTGHAATYAIVVAANGALVEGTYSSNATNLTELTTFGRRVGSTVLRLTRLTDIISPGPAQRAVFIDLGHTPLGNDFAVEYLYPNWRGESAPPTRHSEGTTLSMADGHSEYWKWKGRETVEIPRQLLPAQNTFREVLKGVKDYEVQTEDGRYDLQRLQRMTWGRLGYSPQEGS